MTVLLALLLTVTSPAVAVEGEKTLTMEQALAIAKEKIEIPKSYRDMNSNYDEFGSRKVWRFDWSSQGTRLYKHISVGVDAVTGEIIQFSQDEFDNRRGYESTQGLPKPMSEDKAREAALEFLKKIQPDKISQLRQGDRPEYDSPYLNLGPKMYSFFYERVVDGIPFPDNMVTVTVNAHTGKVRNYYMNWDKVDFPKVEKPVSPSEAEKTLREATDFELGYLSPFNYGPFYNKQKEVELYYAPNGLTYGMVDAATGKLVDPTGKELSIKDKVYREYKPLADNGPKESPGADKKKILSLEEAKSRAADLIDPSGYKLESSRLSDYWGQGKIYEFTFIPQGSTGGNPVNIRIDAVTGEPRGFDNWGGGPWESKQDRKPQYTLEQARKIATEFVVKAFPNKTGILTLNPVEPPPFEAYPEGMQPPLYYFNFVELVNGIPYNGNQISVGIDNVTGKVNHLWVNWRDGLKFKSPGNAVTAREAEEIYFGAVKPRLVYARKAPKEKADLDKPAEVMLVYALNNNFSMMVNALTGVVEYPFAPKSDVKLDDVKDHWAAGEINFLAMQGIITGYDGRFNPDKPITRAEFIKFLAAAKGLEPAQPTGERARFSDVPAAAWYYGYVEAAADAGIIKGNGGKFSPEEQITREEMAVMVIRAMGIEDEPQVELEFKDQAKISAWAKEAVALAIEMELIKGDGDYFRPGNKATRAEAAVLVARAINILAGRGYSFSGIGIEG